MSRAVKRLIASLQRAKKAPKPRLLVDWNLAATAPILQNQFHLGVTVAESHADDTANFDRARTEGLILVSSDQGEPRRLRLPLSPGIVLVEGSLQQDIGTAAQLVGAFFKSYISAGLVPGTPLPGQRVRLRWELGRPTGELETVDRVGQTLLTRFRIRLPRS
jgi:hypothetical protein